MKLGWSFLMALAIWGCNVDDDGVFDLEIEPVDCATLGLDQPAGRGELRGAWDPWSQRLLLFGGNEGPPENCISTTDFLKETWVFYPKCDAFALLELDAAPSKRGRYAMGVDLTRARVVLHGGRFRRESSGMYTLLDDTWVFDIPTGMWSEVASSGPGARYSHTGVAWSGKFIIYGGSVSEDGGVFEPKKDVWAFDLDLATWDKMDTSGTSPGKRLFHGTTVSEDGMMYVFGGGDENAFLGPFFNDLWALDLTTSTWTELHDGSGDAPLGRIWPDLVYDAQRNRLVLWAGHDDGLLGNENEVWAFDLGSGVWERVHEGDVLSNTDVGFCDFPVDFVTPDLTAPERRSAGGTASTDAGLVLTFGGKTDCGLINDLWSYDLATDTWDVRVRATSGEICQRAYTECSSMCGN